MLLLIFGGLAVLATLVGTALYVSESRADSATLSAIGAGSGFRRAWAATHAALLALLGGGLGLAAGLALGTAAGALSAAGRGLPYGASTWSYASIPWQPFAMVAIVIVAAAGLAWVTVRQAPTLTSRQAA